MDRFNREREGYANRSKNRPDRHFVNAGVDGHVEDLHPAEVEDAPGRPPGRPRGG
jgi:hypothetical protein